MVYLNMEFAGLFCIDNLNSNAGNIFSKYHRSLPIGNRGRKAMMQAIQRENRDLTLSLQASEQQRLIGEKKIEAL
jgi:hypothetical protein